MVRIHRSRFDYGFVGGANLATVITATAAIETYLRAEYASTKRIRLEDLIDSEPIEQESREDIYKLRKYRNKWVHVATPEDDTETIQNSRFCELKIEESGKMAERAMRRTIYNDRWT